MRFRHQLPLLDWKLLETSRQRLFAPMIEDVVKLMMKTSKAQIIVAGRLVPATSI